MITRRNLILRLAATSLLAGCRGGTATRFLLAMDRWNEDVGRLLFSSTRPAPEEPESALTPEKDFPSYFIADEIPLPPAGWVLKVGGLVAHPTVFQLEQLKRMPRTDIRIRHYCVEGWSAVASWHGVRLSEIENGRRGSAD